MRKKNYPVKQDLNLAQKEQKHRNLGAAAVTAVVLTVAVALFCKFGVVERLEKLQSAEQSAAQAEALLAQVQGLTARYDDVLEEYRSYTLAHSAMGGGADPMECLDLIEQRLMAHSRVSAFAAADDVISVELSGVTLEEVSAIYAGLMEDRLVAGVQVYTAATTGAPGARVEAAMTIRMAQSREDLAADGEGAAS